MKALPEKEIKSLRFKRKVQTEDGKPIKWKPVTLDVQKEALMQPLLTAIKTLQEGIQLLVQAVTRTKAHQINLPEIKPPPPPVINITPAKKWEFVIKEDGGNKTITATRIE